MNISCMLFNACSLVLRCLFNCFKTFFFNAFRATSRLPRVALGICWGLFVAVVEVVVVEEVGDGSATMDEVEEERCLEDG